MQSCNTKTYNNTTEHTHLQSGDTQHGACCVFSHCFHTACCIDHGRNSSIHNNVTDGTGKSCNFFFFLCHTNGNTHCKEQSQVIEYSTAALVHDIQNGINKSTFMNDAGQVVGFQHGCIGKGTADTQQKTCNGKQSDGEHEGTANTLQNTEKFVFHNFSSFCLTCTLGIC